MSGTLTRINNNQITDAISGNTYFGIDANTKVQPYSITSNLLANNFVYSSNLTVQGDLCVTGNVTAINTTNVTIEDPLLYLASNQTGSPTVDIGYIGQRGTSNNIAFVWDESLTSFATVFTDSNATDNTNINILSYATLTTGDANVTGELLIGGNISIAGNIVSPLNISGNITVGNIATTGEISSTGNISTANFFIGDGYYISNINPGNVSATKISNGNSSANIGSDAGNLVITIANVLVSTFYNNGVDFTGNVSATGTATVGNLVAITDISAVGNIVANGALNGNTLSLSGNVTSSLNVTGNVAANNISAVDAVSAAGNVYGNNVSVTNAISAGGNVTAANFSTTGASGNITGANVIASTTLTATGNVYGGNLLTAGLVSAVGNIQTANYFIGDGAYISNINAANVSSTKISNGNTYANIASADGNLVIAIGANSNVAATFYDTGVSFVGDVSTNAAVNANSLSLIGNVTSALNVTGNVTAQYIVAITDVSALGNIVANSAVNANTLSLSGNVTSTLNVTGNIIAGNIATPGVISSTGTATVGNVSTIGFITATGNVSAGNLIAAASVSAVGSVYTGNVYSGNIISAAGNIITNQTFVGNALSGNTLIITSTSAGLQFSVTGNINAGNTWITNVPDPYAALDVANKQYVDSVAQGLDIKASVAYATAGNIFGTGYTYNNGSSGVGATLTATAVGNLTIDGTVVSAGERVLIKNEVGAFVNNTTQSAAFNGIYTVTTAGSPSVAYVLTRATDFDIGTEMASAFTFVEYGSTQADTGWVCITNNPITVGTTQILWSQFSGAGQYSGGNAISVTGTVIDALYDGNTISRNGSNQLYIPANAPLVTPNIGDATGSSLSVTGSITGNVISSTTLSIIGNINAGNILTSNISLSGNVLGNLNVDNQITGNVINAVIVNTGNLSLSGNVTSTLNVTGNVISGNLVAVYDVSALGNVVSNNALNGNTLSLSGNVTSALNVTGNVAAGNLVAVYDVSAFGNVVSNNALNGNTLSLSGNVTSTLNVTGNVISGNLFTTVNVSAAGNVIGGNILTGGDISSFGNITGNLVNAVTVSASGNITGGNVLVGTGIISTSGNATVGNIDTSGQISALGNISTGNFFIGDGAYISNINAANVSSTKITNGGSYANIASTGGNLVIAVGAASNVVATFYDQGVSLIGNIATNASINANQLSLSGNVVSNLIVTTDVTANNFYGVSTVSVGGNVISGNVSTGNISAGGNVLSGGNFSATGNAIAGNVLTAGNVSATGNLISGNILTGGYISSTGNIQSGTTFLVYTTANSVALGANITLTTGATLAINATDSMLIPVGNVAQRPGSPATGMLRYNSTVSQCEIWNGAAWVAVGGSSYTVIANEQFAGDGSTTVFTLGSSQTTVSCIVTINGVVQIPTTAYAVSGVFPTCVLTFTEAPAIGDIIDVREITTTTSVTAISNTSGNSIVAIQETTGQVDITGNLVAQLNPAAPSLTANSTMSFRLVNNTTLAILVRGTDGVTRTANITVS